MRIPVKSSGSASGSSTCARISAPGHAHPARRLDDVLVDARRRRRRRSSGSGRCASTASATMLFAKPIPRTVRKTRDQDEARQRAADDRRADREARAAVEVAEHDPERQRDQEREPERRPGELELLERLREQEARVVADEPERLDERVRVGAASKIITSPPSSTGRERAARPRAAASQASASATARSAGGVDLGLERRRLLEREEDRVSRGRFGEQERGDRRDRDRRDDGDPQAADDRRHGERQLDLAAAIWLRVRPMPRAASSTSGGAASRPGERSSGRGSRACRRRARSRPSCSVSPVNGTSSWKSARLGIV